MNRSILSTAAGLLAGLVWLALTPFMATTWNCDGVCVDWTGQPLVVRTLGRWLAGLGLLSPPVTSDPYFDYSRFFSLFYLLAIATLAAFHAVQTRRSQRRPRRLTRWAFAALALGLALSAAGDFAGYVVGRFVPVMWNLGWVIEFFSWLIVVPALVAYGAATMREGVMPRWSAWALVAAGLCVPLAAFDGWLVSYMPNAPMLPLAVLCVALGLGTVRARRSSAGPAREP